MKLNLANWERAARVVLGGAAVALAVLGISPWGWLGLIFVVTGAVGFCPIWASIGFSTRK